MGRSSLPLSRISQTLQPPAPAARPQKSPAQAAPQGQGSRPGEVRIIGGAWKRRKLPVAKDVGDAASLRPTPDRVRETLFNWLGQDLTGWRCLDLCAGTGALGFEAASRGASHVTLVENQAVLLAQLRRNRATLQADAVHIAQGDGLSSLRDLARQQPHSLDAIFFDPPFSATWYAPALQAALGALAANGFLYLEAAREWPHDELAELGWQRARHLKAGHVHAHLLRPAAQPQAAP